MLDRINPLIVVRAHWSMIENRTETSTQPDLATRWVLALVPAAVALGALATKLQLAAPGVLVSALSLFSAGLLAAFAQLAAIRSRYPAPVDAWDPDRLTRDMLDEAIAHILTAALLSVTTAVVIIVGMNVGNADGAHINRWFTLAVAPMGTYTFLVFVMTIRKLYGAYVTANGVDVLRHKRPSA